jgi:hypothetical protein
MDTLTAGGIVVLVSAIASLVVAWITARARIGTLPAKTAGHSSSLSDGPVDLPESAGQFRVLGWFLVLLLYLTAVFCVLQGLNDLRVFRHWDQWQAVFGSQLADQAEIALYVRFWLATGIALILIGYWAQRRLRRRSPVG